MMTPKWRTATGRNYFYSSFNSDSENKICRIVYDLKSYKYIDLCVKSCMITKLGSRDSAVDIKTSYGLDDRNVGVRVTLGAIIFSLNVVQIDSEAHSASYTMGTEGSFLDGRSRKYGSIHPLPHTSLIS
jgi:hypothetical protein